jgi:carbon monoxide dehydrogenase subunit G
MDLDSAFTVTAPIDRVWATLMNFEEVAGCVPGAQVLNKLSEDAYQVGMKVKLGPVTMQYKGQMEVVERDEPAYRAVLKGSAKEARGQGTAQATAHLQLVEDGATTRGTVHADVALSGRAAAMGQGVIGSVTDQMMRQFATNLQAMLASDGPGEAVAASVADADAAAGPETARANGAGVASASGTPPSGGAGSGGYSAEGPASDERSSGSASPKQASSESSLNATALALSLVKAQLQQPGRALQAMALVAVVAYRLGLRTGRRERLRWLGPVSG